MQSSSPTFSTLSAVTVSIFCCKIIKKKDNSNICIALIATKKKPMTKPQQATQNQQTEAQKLSQILKLPDMGVNRW